MAPEPLDRPLTRRLNRHQELRCLGALAAALVITAGAQVASRRVAATGSGTSPLTACKGLLLDDGDCPGFH
jgi:hypothetical protein